MKPYSLYAYVGSSVRRTERALRTCGLEHEPPAPVNAIGMGMLEDSRPVIQRRPVRGENPRFIAEIGARITPASICVMAHDGGPKLPTQALPPFRFSGWLSAVAPHDRKVLPFDRRRELIHGVKDHVMRATAGDSGQEALGVPLHDELSQRGIVSSPGYSRSLAFDALREAFRRVHAVLGDDFDGTMVATNGRVLVASAGRSPLYWRWLEGLEPDPEEDVRHPEADDAFRGFIVSSNPPANENPAWRILESGTGVSFSFDEPPEVSLVSE